MDNKCETLRELSLFAGAGGGILGSKLLGWKTVCAVEINRYCQSILCRRQNEGYLPVFPIWDDIKTFDGKSWTGLIDVVSGGFPCQDISAAGKGKGLQGDKSSLWFEMLRIIREIRPRYAFIENSPMLIHRGLETILSNLNEIGYNAKWCIIGASNIGAPHHRKRLWLLAYTDKPGLERLSKTRKKEKPKPWNTCTHISDSSIFKNYVSVHDSDQNPQQTTAQKISWWETEPQLDRMANGVANRVDRITAIGNGQVPVVAAVAWNTLIQKIE